MRGLRGVDNEIENQLLINKNDILLDLEDGLSSVLVTYIFDINNVIKGQLNVEKYEPRHQNLIAIIRQVDYYMKNTNSQGLLELKMNLFLV